MTTWGRIWLAVGVASFAVAVVLGFAASWTAGDTQQSLGNSTGVAAVVAAIGFLFFGVISLWESES